MRLTWQQIEERRLRYESGNVYLTFEEVKERLSAGLVVERQHITRLADAELADLPDLPEEHHYRDFHGDGEDSEPTATYPGTMARVDVMAERFEKRQKLFNSADTQLPDFIGFTGRALRIREDSGTEQERGQVLVEGHTGVCVAITRGHHKATKRAKRPVELRYDAAYRKVEKVRKNAQKVLYKKIRAKPLSKLETKGA
jgi:hypothetical protein